MNQIRKYLQSAMERMRERKEKYAEKNHLQICSIVILLVSKIHFIYFLLVFYFMILLVYDW